MFLRHFSRFSGRFFAAAVAACGLMAVSASAGAAPLAAGCSPDVWSALTAKAEAQVAYDSAVTRAIVDKPDSVLALSCFDKAAGTSAKQGGAIFAGDFTDKLKTVIPNVDNSGYNCTEIKELWNKIVDGGINRGAPYATFEDLTSGNSPAPDDAAFADFNAGWKAAKDANVFSTLNTAVTALQGPPSPPLDFSAAKSSCDVLIAAGVITDCP